MVSATLLRGCIAALLISTAIGARLSFSTNTRELTAAAASIPRDIKWQYQLDDNGTITVTTGVLWYDIDFDTAGDGQLAAVKSKVLGATGQTPTVICYISVGTWEKQRVKQDQTKRNISSTDWTPVLGKSYSPPFQNEKWIDIRSNITKQIMSKRFDYAKTIGCDGVDPDNTGANTEATGFNLTAADAVAYSQWVAEAVHNRSMLVGLKNTIELLPNLTQSYDFFVNEQCGAYNECGLYSGITDKPVFGAEYCDATAAGNGVTQDPGCYCPEALASGRNVLIKNTDLDDQGISCADYCAVNPCPGRGTRKNCKAGKANLCTAVWAKRPGVIG